MLSDACAAIEARAPVLAQSIREQCRRAVRSNAERFLRRPSMLSHVCHNGDLVPLDEVLAVVRFKLGRRSTLSRRLELKGAYLALRLMIWRERAEALASG